MKTAVITGSGSGIGQAIVRYLETEGWTVIELSRTSQDYSLDLSDLQQVAVRADQLAAEVKSIDAVIHVAGLWHDAQTVFANKKLERFTSSQIADTVNVGLTSFMILCARVLPKLSKNGVVIGVSGTFSEGAGGWVPYFTSKRALEDFLVGLAQDYPTGPRIYGISPADTATRAYKKFYPEYAATAQSPDVIASLCLKLIKNSSGYQSGDIIELRDGKDGFGYHR